MSYILFLISYVFLEAFCCMSLFYSVLKIRILISSYLPIVYKQCY